MKIGKIIKGASNGCDMHNQNKPPSLEYPASGTSGADREGEGQSDLETSMNWSPAKRAGQKRSLDAIEADMENIATSRREEEEEGEREEGNGKGADERGGRPGREGATEKAQGQGAVDGIAPGCPEGVQYQATTPLEAEEANRGPGPTDK